MLTLPTPALALQPLIHPTYQPQEKVLPATDRNLSLSHLQQSHLRYSPFHSDPYSRETIEFNESNKLQTSDEVMTQYNTFNETVQQIKLVIHRRVEKDFYGWVDFHDEHYAITNSYYIRRKHLVQNNKKMQKYLKNTLSMQSTGSGDEKVREYIENKIKKELDN